MKKKILNACLTFFGKKFKPGDWVSYKAYGETHIACVFRSVNDDMVELVQKIEGINSGQSCGEDYYFHERVWRLSKVYCYHPYVFELGDGALRYDGQIIDYSGIKLKLTQ